jgi:hypothetical protein
MSKIKARLYNCGGAGTDLGLQVQSDTFTKCYVDASDSNLKEGMDKADCFFIPGLKGSGKNRAENAKIIAPIIPEIMDAHEPGEFNVVVYSLAGGSGSVIGPYIVRYLLEQNLPVISVVIGVTDSATDIKNSMNTLKTLEAFSAATRLPAVVNYHENVSGQPQRITDQSVLFCLEALGDLLTQENDRLDLMDLTNAVQFHKVTPIPAQLAYMGIFDNRQSATQVPEPIVTVSLYQDPDKNIAVGQPHVAYAGLPRNEITSEQLHFIVNTATMEQITTDLITSQTALNQKLGGYRSRKPVVSVDDNMAADGLVL